MENILEVNNIHTFIGQFHILEGVLDCGAARDDRPLKSF